jgi:hypothetical protein
MDVRLHQKPIDAAFLKMRLEALLRTEASARSKAATRRVEHLIFILGQ